VVALRQRRSLCLAVVLIATAGGLAGCSEKKAGAGTPSSAGSASASSPAASDTPTPSATAAPSSAALKLSPDTGASSVAPRAPITASITDGHLTTVTLTNDQGKAVAGALDATASTWTASEALGYNHTYTMTANGEGKDGRSLSQTSTFSTVKPANMTKVYLNTTGGKSLTNGATYGVGIVVVAHFDEAIGDRKAAESALQVTTTPAVAGSWYWTDNQNAHWRPENYFAAGTVVTVNANIYGVQVGSGLFGQEDEALSFKIGEKHVSIADDKTKHVDVYFNDVLQRSMPTSMGRGGSITVNGQKISFWTQPGTYTVIGQGNPVLMNSATYGLPVNSKLGYKENIYWATQISTDGVYLHQLNSTVWAQGHRNLSHGCLNLNGANATWFYKTAQIGDVVQVVNTGGEPLAIWQNGDWSVPWATWQAGSALHS